MELTGLSLAQVLTAFGLVGGAVLILYLLKLRRRVVAVPFVKLWERVLADKQTTRLFSRLKRLLSLLLALLLVGLLAAALGDPMWSAGAGSGRTLVMLVDGSASMQAIDVSPSRIDQAKERAVDLVRSLGPDDRLLVAQMTVTTQPLSPLTSSAPMLQSAIESLAAEDVEADLAAAFRFARDVLRDEPNPEVVLVSDGKLGSAELEAQTLRESGVRISWIPIGSSDAANLAITAFAVRRYPLDRSQSEVLVEVWNPTAEDSTIELSLLGDGQTVHVETIEVASEARRRKFYRNLAGADQTLEARLRPVEGPPDMLPVDSVAYALLPPRRRARVLAVSAGNLYLSAALLLDEYLDVVEVKPDDYPVEGSFDVVIFDGWVPPSPPATGAIYLNPNTRPGQTGPFEVRGMVDRPFFDRIDRDHPLVQFVSLRDVNVSQSLDVVLRDGDHIVAGGRNAPLLVTGRRDDHRMVALLFDLRESDLPLRIAWPLLLLHAIDGFVQDEAGYLSSYRTGETWHVPVPSGARSARLRGPGVEQMLPLVNGRAVHAGRQTGFFTVQSDVSGQTVDSVIAANLGGDEEADIARIDELTLGGEPASRVSRSQPHVHRKWWPWLVLAALCLLLVEYATFHRRLTV